MYLKRFGLNEAVKFKCWFGRLRFTFSINKNKLVGKTIFKMWKCDERIVQRKQINLSRFTDCDYINSNILIKAIKSCNTKLNCDVDKVTNLKNTSDHPGILSLVLSEKPLTMAKCWNETDLADYTRENRQTRMMGEEYALKIFNI